jgi:two-component system sensor histidine kinase YesM
MQKVTQAEILEKEMEFKTLQSQMNPHFLYNTLDAINWMAFKQKQTEICNLISAISNLMRISISNKQSLIPLEQELGYVKDYLYIQSIRYKDRLETVYDIDAALLGQVIPKLIIQPIVENAIVHGIEKSYDKNTLYISAIRMGGNIDIIVKDTGVGMPEEKVKELLKEPETVKSSSASHTNLGIYAVHKRLQFLYGEDYGLSVQSEMGEGTTVVIHIPYMEDPQKVYEKYNGLLGKRQ